MIRTPARTSPPNLQSGHSSRRGRAAQRRSVALGRAIALTVAAGFALAACGIPASGPQVLHSGLPQVLELKPQRESQGSGPPSLKGGVTVNIYLIQGLTGELVQVQRTVPRLTVQAVLDQLEDGPTFKDSRDDYESAVASRSHLQAIGVSKRTHVATVQLDSYFEGLTGEEPVEELGQIVWTLTMTTALHVDAVRFISEAGSPAAVPTLTGHFTSQPVSRSNYRFCAIGCKVGT